MNKKKEEKLSIAVSNYIKLQYPNVIFLTDDSGVWLPKGLASIRAKQRSRMKIPDVLILEPKGGYHGLVIELKTVDKSPFLKDGSISRSKHVQEQLQSILHLANKGYYACFGVGFDDCKAIIDNYMNLK